MDSPRLAQKVRVNQFVAQLVRTSGDESLPEHIRERARRTRKLLPEVPHLGDLVPDLEKPWQPCDISAARGEEWESAFAGRVGKVGLVVSAREKLPWVTKLPPWTRALVARYFLGSSPINERLGDVGGKRKYAAVVMTRAEKRALRILRILLRHGRDGEEGKEDVSLTKFKTDYP